MRLREDIPCCGHNRRCHLHFFRRALQGRRTSGAAAARSMDILGDGESPPVPDRRLVWERPKRRREEEQGDQNASFEAMDKRKKLEYNETTRRAEFRGSDLTNDDIIDAIIKSKTEIIMSLGCRRIEFF